MNQIIQLLSFLGFASIVLSLMVAYTGRRLISPAELPRGQTICCWLSLALPVVSVVVTMMLSRLGFGSWFDIPLGASHLAFGFFALLFSFTLMRDVFWLLLRGVSLVQRFAGRAGFLPSDREPRLRILHKTNLVLVPLVGVLLAVGMAQALLPPRVVNVRIPILDLHPDLAGFRIVQLSDIHLSPWVGEGHVRDLVTRTNSLNPDLVAITGDLVDGSVEARGQDALPLTSLEAPAFFVTGNHEAYSGAEEWIVFLKEHGIRVLDGEKELIQRGTATLLLAGVADPAVSMPGESRRSDPAAIDITNSPVIDLRVLLAHQPRAAYRAAEAGFDLQISGHTHNGQFFPLMLIIDFIQPFATGLNNHNGMWIYTSRGARFWGPPLRLFNPPEMALIELVPAE